MHQRPFFHPVDRIDQDNCHGNDARGLGDQFSKFQKFAVTRVHTNSDVPFEKFPFWKPFACFQLQCVLSPNKRSKV